MFRASTPPAPFPLYFLPNLALPFRRRSSDATATTSRSSTSSSPPTEPTSYLSSSPVSYLRCVECLTDITPISSIISKGFTGRNGRAYLVAPPNVTSVHGGAASDARTGDQGLAMGSLPNITTHKPSPRQLVTGAHVVSDVSCKVCGAMLGWKYVDAQEDSQTYKIGKYILETMKVVRGAGWESEGYHNEELAGSLSGAGEVEFDSQDEDECEDLFMGMWSPQIASGRRRLRAATRRKLLGDDA